MALFLLESLFFATCLTQSFMSLKREPRIVNGIASPISQFPFIAALRDIEYDLNDKASISDAWCGGSLIRKSYPAAILTASHCVVSSTGDIIVELNASHTQQAPILGISAWRVIHTATHELFDSYSLDNDIAILFIDVDLSHRNDLHIVTIPTSIECCANGETLQIIGYGRTSLGGSYSATLEHTDLELMDRTTCNQRLCLWETQTDNCQFVYANENNICGIGDQTTPCHGDSGAPLIKKGSTEQIGVVSWGIDCATSIPTIFTNTALYDTWINGKLNQFIGRNSVAAAVMNVQPITTPVIKEEEALPMIIHHMFATSDVAQGTTLKQTESLSHLASVEANLDTFSNSSDEVHPSTSDTKGEETTDILWINESDASVIRKLRSIFVTALGFSAILCTLTTAACCCKQKDKEETECEINVAEEQMIGNPYIIKM